MDSRGYLDISFSWIFAILVGGMIIFGAVYGLSKFTDTARVKGSAEAGTEFSNLLSPLETDAESGKIITLTFPVETRVSNICQTTSTFGRQGFSLSEKIRGEWIKNPPKIFSENRYVFSKSEMEGKKFYSFSKPLEMPFKVADLIYLIPEEDIYCFRGNIDRDLENELENFNNPNLLTSDCKDREDVIKVCFSDTSSCEIKVNYDGQYVEKNGERVYFLEDSLLLAAIFSDKENYDCELKRILYRTKSLTGIYQEKGLDLIIKGCESPVASSLSTFKTKLNQIENSKGLSLIESEVESLYKKNKFSSCKLW